MASASSSSVNSRPFVTVLCVSRPYISPFVTVLENSKPAIPVVLSSVLGLRLSAVCCLDNPTTSRCQPRSMNPSVFSFPKTMRSIPLATSSSPSPLSSNPAKAEFCLLPNLLFLLHALFLLLMIRLPIGLISLPTVPLLFLLFHAPPKLKADSLSWCA